MSDPDPLLFSLQKMLVSFSLVERNHYLAGTQRRESDVEHSFSVALLCWFIHDRYNIDLDISKILKYALAHDLVEVYAGDINTFANKEAREQKIVNEMAALKRLAGELKSFPSLVDSMHRYEDKLDDEARFVWTVDKMQALIMGELDNWRPYKELGIDYHLFSKKHAEQLENASPHLKEIFETLFEHCKATYYDQPKKEK